MKIDVDPTTWNQGDQEFPGIRIREVFSGLILETSDGNRLGICMRDDTMEMNIMPDGKHTNNWWRIDMQKGEIKPLSDFCSSSQTETCTCTAGPEV